MELTTEMLAAFVGGQIEVQNEREDYLYRGQIKTAQVSDEGEVCVELHWMAKGDEGFPSANWTADDKLSYVASLEVYSASNIGPSPDGGGDRLCLTSGIIGETVVFYPPGGSKLDPARVKNLVVVEPST